MQPDSMLKSTTDIFARSVIIHGGIDNIDKATFLLDVSLSFELKRTRRVVRKDIRTLTIQIFMNMYIERFIGNVLKFH